MLQGFDQACRCKAIRLAACLNLKAGLNLNLVPNSSRHTRRNVRLTLDASLQEGFPVERLVFEVSEAERMHHYARVGEIFKSYQDQGFRTAIDDFGAGLAGLHMLAEYQPDFVKLDRSLIADVHEKHVKQVLVGGLIGACRQLSIEPIAEGVGKAEEYHWLREAGIHFFQGFYFARPELKPWLTFGRHFSISFQKTGSCLAARRSRLAWCRYSSHFHGFRISHSCNPSSPSSPFRRRRRYDPSDSMTRV